jgi:hypothetical protein
MIPTILLAAALLSPQPTYPDVTNPSHVAFTPSPDHAAVTYYELDILRPDGSVLQTLNLGTCTPDQATGDCTVAVNVQPIAFGKGYYDRLRAVATTPTGVVYSDYTISVNKFDRAPGGPSKVVNK